MSAPDRPEERLIADRAAPVGVKVCAHTVAVLRDRAESYGRDAVVFRSDGDTVSAVIYETVRDELRLCADVLEAE